MNKAPASFRLITLGQPALFSCASEGAEDEILLGPGKPLALLSYCCAVREREHSRDHLTTLLWSDSDTTRARQSLRQALWRLRSVIGAALSVTDDAVRGVSGEVSVDRDDFVSAVHRGDATGALATYRGAFLRGISIPGGDEFEEWAAIERRQLEASLIRVVGLRAKELCATGRNASVRAMLTQLLKRTPESVEAHRMALELSLQISEIADVMVLADTLESLARFQECETAAIHALIVRARKPVADKSTSYESLTLDLVGRQEVFGGVMRAWAQARSGITTSVSLTGAPGIGNTRLLNALSQRFGSKGAASVLVRANQGERDVNFAFAASIARALATRPGAGGISSASARELVSLDPALGSQFASAGAVSDSGDSVRTRALAIVDLLGAICEPQPLALLIDDLHWSDAASRQLLSIILARTSDLPLLTVVAFRGHAQPIGAETMQNFPLLPLNNADMVDAIRSTGKWPESGAANEFVESLARVSEGVPLATVERLSLVRDAGLISFQAGEWHSDNWWTASEQVSVAAPVDQRIASCSAVERRLLLAMAITGVPRTEATLREILQRESVTAQKSDQLLSADPVAAALSNLEVRGLVVRLNDVWMPVHDVIAERLLELSDPAERTAIHVLFAGMASQQSDEEAATAFRHYFLAKDDANAAAQFRRVLKQRRHRGDTRHAREILLEISGDRLSPERQTRIIAAQPFWIRRGEVRSRWVIGSLSIACLVLASLVFSFARQPKLGISQLPMTTYPLTSFSSKTLRTMPSAAISLGSLKNGDTMRMVHVKSLGNQTKIVAGDSVAVVDGVALFNTLRFESSEPIVRLRFESPGYDPTEVAVTNTMAPKEKGTEQTARLRIVGGRIAGTQLSSNAMQVRVRAGSNIAGFVQVAYSTNWATSSVWLSMTPTWGDPQAIGHDIVPVMTPVRQEVVDANVSLRAPETRGRYWIIFVIDAEDSGGYTLSRTNWTVGHPIWGDGNDVAQMSDSAIARANADGYAVTNVAYHRDWNTTLKECELAIVKGERPLKLCGRRTALGAVEVVVE